MQRSIGAEALGADYVFWKVTHAIGIDRCDRIAGSTEVLRNFLTWIDSYEVYGAQWHVSSQN